MSKAYSKITYENIKNDKLEKMNDNNKEKELEEFFNKIQKENEELKTQIIKYKLEFENENEKNKNLKDTYLSINSFNDPTININTVIYENIKLIKLENEKQLNELNLSYENLVKSTKKENLQIKNSIKDTLDNYDNNNKLTMSLNNNLTKSILEDIEKYENKIESLLELNYNKEKYSLMLNQKYELSTEENKFLKGRILEEKINIIEKLDNFNKENTSTNIEIIKNLLNELNLEKKNFLNNQFLIPIESLTQSLNESRQNEKNLKEQNEKMKIICEELKTKIESMINEKNEMIGKSKDLYINSEKTIINGKALNSEISRLKKEIEILKNKNENLLKNNASLNTQIENINNKIELQLKNQLNENDILINQKNLMIEELSNKLAKGKFNLEDYERKIQDLNEEINEMKNIINEYNNKENYYQNELIKTKNQLNKQNIDLKKNNNLEKQITNLKKEKENIENKLKNLINEYNILKNNKMILSKDKEELENNYNNLKIQQNDRNKLLNNDLELLKNLQNNIRQIYQIHFNKNEINSKNELFMLKEINEKLSQNNLFIKQSINKTEDFPLDQNENSQFYENLILYILNLKSEKLINGYENKEKNTIDYPFSGNTTNKTTPKNTNGNKTTIEELKLSLEEKYEQMEDRIKTSCPIEDLEKILQEIKYLYEQIIDYIIQAFYNSKTDLSDDNILTIQMQLENYHQIINNTNGNLSKIEQYINQKIMEYRNQGNKIDSSFSLLMKYINGKN